MTIYRLDDERIHMDEEPEVILEDGPSTGQSRGSRSSRNAAFIGSLKGLHQLGWWRAQIVIRAVAVLGMLVGAIWAAAGVGAVIGTSIRATGEYLNSRRWMHREMSQAWTRMRGGLVLVLSSVIGLFSPWLGLQLFTLEMLRQNMPEGDNVLFSILERGF